MSYQNKKSKYFDLLNQWKSNKITLNEVTQYSKNNFTEEEKQQLIIDYYELPK
jgi:hypothetical protein